MKKFFSIFCALAIVLSAGAAPAKNPRAKKLQRATIQRLYAQKNAQNKQNLGVKPFAATDVAPKALNVADRSQTPAFRAPKAEVTDVTCASWDIFDNGTDGELYLYSEDNTYAFYFDLIYGEGAEDLVLGKTYTVDDIDSDDFGQLGGVFYNGEWVYGIKELSLVKTVDEKELVHFAGSCTDARDNSFTFHYDEKEFIPTGDTVSYAFLKKASISFSDYDNSWTVKADDGKYAFTINFFGNDPQSPAGIYTSKDFDLSFTYVEVYTAKDSSNYYNAKKANALLEVQNDTTFILADILAEDGVVYSFSAFYAAPTKQGEDTIVATNLIVDDVFFDWFGMVSLQAYNDDYGVLMTLETENDTYLGEYAIGAGASGDIYLFKEDTVPTTIFSGDIKLEKTNGEFILTGKVLCYNDVEYTLDIKYVKPEKTREEELIISDAVLTIFPESGDWQVTGFNEDSTRFVAIDILGDTVPGSYTEDDLVAYYTSISNVFVRNDSLLTAEQYQPLTLDISVAFNDKDSTAVITGTYLGQGFIDTKDVPEFTLHITAKVTVYDPSGSGSEFDADEDFIVDFDQYTVDDQYLDEFKVLVISAVNELGNIVNIEYNPALGATDIAPGVYPIDDSSDPLTIASGFITDVIYGSFAGNLLDNDMISIPLWLFAQGTVTINEDGSILVDALNTKGAAIKCNLKARTQGIEQIQLTEEAQKILINGVLYIVRDNKLFNLQGAQIR